MSGRRRVLSGIQPTGAGKHLGNYLGAVRHWAAMQDEFECFYFMADLHSLTITPDPKELREQCRKLVAELLVEAEQRRRRDEHPELAWVLSCLTGFGEASRMTQFKEKGGGNVGLFNYPVLQAADILLYQAHMVPVGEDQRQHLELTRDLGQRFNSRYGDTFTVPDPYVQKSAERIKDLQDPTAKMSTSKGGPGVLWVIEDDTQTLKKIKSAVTDTGREVSYDVEAKPGISNLLTILSVATGSTVDQLTGEFDGKGYGDFKAAVADAVIAMFAPVRRRFAELIADPGYLDAVLREGAAKAGPVARETMTCVRDRIGLLAPA